MSKSQDQEVAALLASLAEGPANPAPAPPVKEKKRKKRRKVSAPPAGAPRPVAAKVVSTHPQSLPPPVPMQSRTEKSVPRTTRPQIPPLNYKPIAAPIPAARDTTPEQATPAVELLDRSETEQKYALDSEESSRREAENTELQFLNAPMRHKFVVVKPNPATPPPASRASPPVQAYPLPQNDVLPSAHNIPQEGYPDSNYDVRLTYRRQDQTATSATDAIARVLTLLSAKAYIKSIGGVYSLQPFEPLSVRLDSLSQERVLSVMTLVGFRSEHVDPSIVVKAHRKQIDALRITKHRCLVQKTRTGVDLVYGPLMAAYSPGQRHLVYWQTSKAPKETPPQLYRLSYPPQETVRSARALFCWNLYVPTGGKGQNRPMSYNIQLSDSCWVRHQPKCTLVYLEKAWTQFQAECSAEVLEAQPTFFPCSTCIDVLPIWLSLFENHAPMVLPIHHDGRRVSVTISADHVTVNFVPCSQCAVTPVPTAPPKVSPTPSRSAPVARSPQHGANGVQNNSQQRPPYEHPSNAAARHSPAMPGDQLAASSPASGTRAPHMGSASSVRAPLSAAAAIPKVKTEKRQKTKKLMTPSSTPPTMAALDTLVAVSSKESKLKPLKKPKGSRKRKDMSASSEMKVPVGPNTLAMNAATTEATLKELRVISEAFQSTFCKDEPAEVRCTRLPKLEVGTDPAHPDKISVGNVVTLSPCKDYPMSVSAISRARFRTLKKQYPSVEASSQLAVVTPKRLCLLLGPSMCYHPKRRVIHHVESDGRSKGIQPRPSCWEHRFTSTRETRVVKMCELYEKSLDEEGKVSPWISLTIRDPVQIKTIGSRKMVECNKSWNAFVQDASTRKGAVKTSTDPENLDEELLRMPIRLCETCQLSLPVWESAFPELGPSFIHLRERSGIGLSTEHNLTRIRFKRCMNCVNDDVAEELTSSSTALSHSYINVLKPFKVSTANCLRPAQLIDSLSCAISAGQHIASLIDDTEVVVFTDALRGVQSLSYTEGEKAGFQRVEDVVQSQQVSYTTMYMRRKNLIQRLAVASSTLNRHISVHFPTTETGEAVPPTSSKQIWVMPSSPQDSILIVTRECLYVFSHPVFCLDYRSLQMLAPRVQKASDTDVIPPSPSSPTADAVQSFNAARHVHLEFAASKKRHNIAKQPICLRMPLMVPSIPKLRRQSLRYFSQPEAHCFAFTIPTTACKLQTLAHVSYLVVNPDVHLVEPPELSESALHPCCHRLIEERLPYFVSPTTYAPTASSVDTSSGYIPFQSPLLFPYRHCIVSTEPPIFKKERHSYTFIFRCEDMNAPPKPPPVPISGRTRRPRRKRKKSTP